MISIYIWVAGGVSLVLGRVVFCYFVIQKQVYWYYYYEKVLWFWDLEFQFGEFY